MAKFKMAAIIKLRQSEWVKFFCANGGNHSWQVWVSMRGKTKMVESKMAKLKKAAIIKLSENEWVWVRLQLVWVWVLHKMAESKDGRIQDGCHHQVDMRRNEFESDWISLSKSFAQNGWIQNGRVQDGCHHQVESEWISEDFCVKWLRPRWQNSSWQNSW